ncbi:DUF3880 domain-containing protein, partial [Thermodesulfobacteriota bacterium]
MKILVTGYHNPLYQTIVEYIENGIKKLGHELISFDDHQHIFPGRIRNKLKFLDHFDTKRINKKLLYLAIENKPELVIVTQGFDIQKETVQHIHNLGIPIVMWVIDAPINFSNILDAAPCYDFIFCGGTEAVDIFEKLNFKNIKWLPFACDPEYHYPVKEDGRNPSSFRKDVVFVGSNYTNRNKIFESLDLKSFDFGIWGSGWDRVSKNSPLKRFIQKTHTEPEEWVKIYSNSKIIIVAHYPSTEEMPVYQASPKIYEAMACGGFVMCDNQQDVKTLFKEKEHLVIFQDINDLNEKIKY